MSPLAPGGRTGSLHGEEAPGPLGSVPRPGGAGGATLQRVPTEASWPQRVSPAHGAGSVPALRPAVQGGTLARVSQGLWGPEESPDYRR